MAAILGPMTYLALVQRLWLESGSSGGMPTTVLNPTPGSEWHRLCTWIAQAYLDIQLWRDDWLWMEQDVIFDSIAGQQEYPPETTIFSTPPSATGIITMTIAPPAVVSWTAHGLQDGDRVVFTTTGALPSGVVAGQVYFVLAAGLTANSFQFSATDDGVAVITTGIQSGVHTAQEVGLTDFRRWKINGTSGESSFRCFLKSVGVVNEVNLDASLDYKEFRDYYIFGAKRLVRSRPISICVGPKKQLMLGFTPNDVYTVDGRYIQTPTVLVNDTDIPTFNSRYHMVLVYLALYKYAFYEVAPEVIASSKKMATDMIWEMENEQLPDIQLADPLVG